jgi:TRAP-type transport system periplasmic protein
MRSPARAAVGLGFAAILAGAACSPPAASPQSTEPQQTRTLGIATDDEPGRPAADQIEEFARQVKELSGGTLLIEPLWKAVGEDKDDWDQAVARGVMAGDFDMGLVPARAWDTEGVDSFAALHAPFLVTNNALLAKVIEPGVADEMLSGLDKLGVAGLALFPESTRTLFAFGNPVLKPADLAGKTIRAPRSDTTYALLTALGASPDDLAGEVFPDGVVRHEKRGRRRRRILPERRNGDHGHRSRGHSLQGCRRRCLQQARGGPGDKSAPYEDQGLGCRHGICSQ